MTQELVITRGLPASGKTTFAEAYLKADPDRRGRVNRDDLRAAMFAAPDYGPEQEKLVTSVQQHAVRQLLRAGRCVVVDDTNLRAKFARAWADMAVEEGVEFRVVDFLDVSVHECVARDAMRAAKGGRRVGVKVIMDMHQRFLASGPLPEITPSERHVAPTPELYVPDQWLPRAWIVDLDGTLAHMGDRRRPYDWDKVGLDELDENVALFIDDRRVMGDKIVLMSGREDVCRAETEAWLAKHGISYDALHMRAAGDGRKDSVVKRELFDAHVREHYQVVGALDDRDQVVQLWRSMGIPCWQVAPGAF